MRVNNEITLSNGNVNVSRDVVNNNITKYAILGQAKRFAWDSKRSFRSI